VVIAIRIVINAVALLLAALLVPGIEVSWSEEASGVVISLLVLAIVFGLVNAAVRPIVRFISLPLNILTLGTFSLVLNALLLLAVAALVDLANDPLIVIGEFPPDLGLPALAAAVMGAFVISLVSTGLNLFITDH
jgi:putative membrane protein